MIVGMDFGTTNSGQAHFDGRQVHLLPLDPTNAIAPHVLRTTLYISRGQQHYIGREAIEEYHQRNQGRPIQLKREHVGEIQLTFADLGSFWRDVYVWVDELEPGRLFRSIKSCLPDTEYVGTSVWGEFYRLEDLVGAFLRQAKRRAERLLDREVSRIVLGRPVHFGDPAQDRVAEERLARAALLAGYEEVYFELEPIAAALSYQQQITFPQRVLVFDFGGGTLDLTVMEFSDQQRSQVLATGGARTAGDVFDRRIVRNHLAKFLGEDVTYGPKKLRLPVYILDELADWQTMILLNRPEVLKVLRQIEQAADAPGQIRALLSLIRNNYGLMMFEAVERAKINLSSRDDSLIQLSGREMDIRAPLSRKTFERLIHPDARRIAACADETLNAAGLQHEQIDAVVRTGGSSLIPLFQRLLAARFGREKLRPIDEFSSVTSGLGIAAHLLEQGRRDLRGYTPADLSPEPPPAPPEEEEEAGLANRGY